MPPDVSGLRGRLKSGGAAGSLTFAVRDSDMLRPAVNQLKDYFQRKYGPGTVAIASSLDWIERDKRQIVPVLTVIGFMAGCGLLIAALNILNLMVARVLRRTRSIGISAALGASRRTIFQTYLYESLLLGASRGILGLGAAYGLTGLLRGILTRGDTGGPDMNLTWQVLAIAALTTLAVNLIFGVYPAYRAARTNPVDALRMD
ncbi:MAG: ABC transporter permease [Bacteroidota bacterium]